VKRLVAIYALTQALVLGGPVAPARAQDPLTPERVQFALDVTDRRIDQAHTLVDNADNDRARIELATAVDTQSRAKSAFAAAQLRIAAGLTLEARDHADRAIAIVKGLPDPDRVQAQIERTREIIDRAREGIDECDNDRAHALLQVALAMQGRAEDAAANGRFLAALQLTMSARERALRAMRLCHLVEDLKDSSERALRRTDDVIARAQEAVHAHPSEEARHAVGQAVDTQAQAQGEYRATHYDAALRLTQAARTMAQRALRLVGRG
jgi:hypothetical protein